MDYLSPRRFARVLEMDRNGPPMCGSLEEQQALRDAISEYAAWDNRLDRVLFAVDKAINTGGRKFIPVTLWHEPGRQSFWGRSTRVIIQLFPPDRPTARSEWEYVFWHEFGHIVGYWLTNEPDANDRLGWARDFQWWVMNGQPEHHYIWQRLEPLTTPVA